MKITVKLFASLQGYLPSATQDYATAVEIADGASPADVLAQLRIPAAKAHLLLRNGVFIAPADRAKVELCEGDVLALWPPVAGG